MCVSNRGGDGLKIWNQLTLSVVLRALPELALGLVAVVFLTAAFLGATVLGAAVFATVAFLGATLAAAAFLQLAGNIGNILRGILPWQWA